MIYPRFLKDKVLKSLNASPVLLLTWGRQSGKTTLVKEIAENNGYDFISLDDMRYVRSAREDPIGFLEQFSKPLIIDEVQRSPCSWRHLSFWRLKKLISWCPIRLQSYHFRTSSGIEVDLVLENRAGEIVAIEIKNSETPHPNDFKGLKSLRDELGSRFKKGILLYPGGESLSFGEKIFAVPMRALFE